MKDIMTQKLKTLVSRIPDGLPIDAVILTKGIETVGTGIVSTNHSATYHACENIMAEGKVVLDGIVAWHVNELNDADYTMLKEHGVGKTEQVDLFFKKDFGKTRYDLLLPKFVYCINELTDDAVTLTFTGLKTALLYLAQNDYKLKEGDRAPWTDLLLSLTTLYTSSELEKGVADVLTFGMKKYAINNWKKCDDPGQYCAAAFRHIVKVQEGELADKETGLSHWFHYATNVMFLMHFTKVIK